MLVDHYILTGWMFFIQLAVLFVVVLILICQLRNPSGTTEKSNQPTVKSKSKKDSCIGAQTFGFLSNWPTKTPPPKNCQSCPSILECREKNNPLNKAKAKLEPN